MAQTTTQQQVPSLPEEPIPIPSGLLTPPLSRRMTLSRGCGILYSHLKEKSKKSKGARYDLPGVTQHRTSEASNQQEGPSSRPVELTPLAATSENSTTHSLPDQVTPTQGCEASSSRPEGVERVNSARHDTVSAVPGNQGLFWRQTLPRIATTCGVLGLVLAVAFGVAQWLAQDKSIAIARESELVSLALSCSDEVRTTAVVPKGDLTG
ncbi:hypothetical protein GGR58DRAFT_302554 [Xylaria digitata]|nr:hypothetical protein GGR58DRAFT_302554 [Xylaria digitata]